MNTKRSGILLAGVLALSAAGAFAGCSANDSLAAEMFGFGDEYYSSVSKRFTLNYDEMLYDDFTGDKLNKDMWVVSDSVWDQWGTDQNGVRPQNVFLLKDDANPEAHLLIKANGSYYSGDALSSAVDGVNTGGCISTVEAMGPGRYDIKMKACPTIGALTSMWLFSWFNKDDGTVQQNEIDIEIGLNPYFDKVYFTTWTAPAANTSHGQSLPFMVNDGDWHIYSFDWVTDTDVPYVDYYVDGQLLYTSTVNVPSTNATISIGIWVPSWAGGGVTDSVYNVSTGSRMFDTDYAQISWWRYVPFEMGGWEQRPSENRNYDPDYELEVLTKTPVVNKCSNGDFELEDDYYYKKLVNARDTLPTEIETLKEQLKNETDENKINQLNEEIASKTSAYQTVIDMLASDSAPWKDYTLYGKNEYDGDGNLISERRAARVLDELSETPNYCAMVTGDGIYGQWLRAACTGYKYKVTGRYRSQNGGIPSFRYTHYIGFSTTSATNGSTSIKIGDPKDEWTEFEFEFVIGSDGKTGTQSIRYHFENYNYDVANAVTYFDDITITYLGHS